jgi:peptidoglycan/LPS O-acetylase OafA/YrhL
LNLRVPYRPDIDGLRAIAVLSVIFFHAGFLWAKGGFLGVDVFFVISGYLITGILLREQRDGSFSLARFYERRARRILPAPLLVIAATLVGCVLLMVAGDARVVARSAVAVLAFSANIMFWRGVDFGDVATVNYFGRRLHEQPLIHTWSLGVEEQYYLLFPLALLLVWRLRPQLVLPFLIAGTAASLLLSAWLTPRSPGMAFYLLPTRAWQLLAGGLVAWNAVKAAPSRNWKHELAAVAGLLLILVPA